MAYKFEDSAICSFFKQVECSELSIHQLVDPTRLSVEEVGNVALLVEGRKIYRDIAKVLWIDTRCANCPVLYVADSPQAGHHLTDEPTGAEEMMEIAAAFSWAVTAINATGDGAY